MTVTPVMVMVANREMESYDRARPVVNRRCANRRINDRRGTVNDSRLINHRGLRVDDCGLRVNDRGLRLHDNVLNRLMNDDRCRIHINSRRCVNRPRFECLGDQQARSHACHDFSSGCPFLVACVGPCDGTSENSQGCCDH
jgi:hypothetical protein